MVQKIIIQSASRLSIGDLLDVSNNKAALKRPVLL